MTHTVAAVDCGTNSIRLLILERDDHGQVTELARETRLARLGQGVDATGEFHPDALERTFTILDEYASLISAHGAQTTRFVATSAARDVSNRDVLEEGVQARLGVPVEVISGDEEARLSTKGVLSGVDAPLPALVIDIGGGSTELVVICDGGQIRSAISLDIGAVRIKERFLHTEPATPDEVAAAHAYIGELLDGSGTDFGAVATAIGVAGTVTSLAADHLGLTQYSREAVHQVVLPREVIESTSRRWLSMTTDELVASSPIMHPLRAAVIGAGSMILDGISRRIPGGDVLVSETDILDGIALGMLNP